ncbi:hypothetical protein BDZ90DRAFT_257604 [Jaminaea rosea]|uniref:Mitochondrial genome maintenance protein Mgr2 n=1 Tax=Jaminaea rosea TaxID=1569628 RepID=A0A316V545_9BASI|nr:hypothetical protein BDZ90DRAFT_257604 [Jaminaea rosea]PWN30525.1 hypothetical protein BDZ90DRAFT_257604 [Jaminaea rosea]
MPPMPAQHFNPGGQSGQVQVVPQAPSVWQKLSMGAMMGTGVGLSIGFIGGMVQIMRAGPGPRGTLATLSQYMATSGATFAFFLSIGSVIRTEDGNPANEAAWRQTLANRGRIVTAARPAFAASS